MSHHFLVEARLKFVVGWKSAGGMKGLKSVFRVSELKNRV